MNTILVLWNVVLTAAVLFNLYTASTFSAGTKALEATSETLMEAQIERNESILAQYDVNMEQHRQALNQMSIYLQQHTEILNEHAAMLEALK